MKKILLVVAVLALAGIAWWAYVEGTTPKCMIPEGCDGEQPVTTQPNEDRSAEAVPEDRVVWSFDEADPGDGMNPPKTRVTAHVGAAPGTSHDLGLHDGSCSTIEGSAWELVEGEISGAICWWAGGGTELGAFREGGRLVIKRGVIEEGSAEEPGFRGNFETVVSIN